MIKQGVKKTLQYLGYELHKISPSQNRPSTSLKNLPPIEPVWPLPRRKNGPSDDEIRKAFSSYDLWHYAYSFEGGLSFKSHHNHPGAQTEAPERPLQRFRHFMPYLVDAYGGSLKGKRILDIACNSGFWSIQCALMGAKVVGFDARPELIEQANLIKSLVGVSDVEFTVLDFWKMSPQSLGGTFDIVLNLGILYHLNEPLKVLELTRSMANETILLDTCVHKSKNSIVKLHWEEPSDIRNAATSGIVAKPSKSSIEIMLKHMKVAEWCEIPVRSNDLPLNYLEGGRASWLIKV